MIFCSQLHCNYTLYDMFLIAASTIMGVCDYVEMKELLPCRPTSGQ